MMAILVEGWELDLSAVTGQGLSGTIGPLDTMGFIGAVTHVATNDVNNNGLADPGERSIIDTLGAINALKGFGFTRTTSTAGERLNRDFEITFDFTVGAESLSFDGVNQTFTHLAPGESVGTTVVDGLLEVYIQGPGSGGPNARLDLRRTALGGGTVAGITDGTLVATFRVLAGDGGLFNVNTLDGTDDASFELVSALPGVFRDSNGDDLGALVAGGQNVLLAFSDSNFDLDPDGNTRVDSGPPAGWTHPRQGTGSATNAFGTQDGTLVLAEDDQFQLATIGDFVWHDLDADGIQDMGEPGIPGVTVNLYNSTNSLVGTDVTDSSGAYLFEDLIPGDYHVEVVAPPGYFFTLKDQGSNDAVDSDVNPLTGEMDVTTLDSGEVDLTWDAGLIQATAGINIVKLTNGTDNNSPTGPVVPVGSTVTFTYIVTNTGNVPLADVVVVDDQGVVVTYVSGDTDNDDLLDVTETWTYTGTTIAVAGQYVNNGTVTGNPVDEDGNDIPFLPDQTDTDIDHHFAPTTGINIVKLTNGTDNNSPTGPVVPVGSTVTFTYIVTNTGNVPLADVVVVDDQGVVVTYVSGDTDSDDLLDVTETWTYTGTTIAVAGQYVNNGTVTGNPVEEDGDDIPFLPDQTDTDIDHHFAPTTGINIVKLTNGTDNNSPTGPVVPVGSTVTFTYIVTNTGNVPLADVVVVDDQGVVVTYVSGDTDNDDLLDVTETWTYTGTTIAVAGQYVNNGTVTGNPVEEDGDDIPFLPDQTDTDIDHHFAPTTGINIVKLTNGTDNNSPTGPVVPVGSTVTFTYIVTNTGNVPLADVVVVDDQGVVVTYVSGDTDNDDLLDVTETWTYTGTTIAVAGQYVNNGTVTGNPVEEDGDDIPFLPDQTDTDIDHHFAPTTGIDIVKLTNGTDNNSPTGPVVPVGSTVTFTYIVTNTGNVPLASVVVRDDNGTQGNTADDFNATYVSGDTDLDGRLDVTETWTYTASRIASAGQYKNFGTVTGNPVTETGVDIPFLPDQTDTDVDHHFAPTTGIDIVKLTNGTDNNSPTGPVVPVGSTVTFTYIVTNTGNVPLASVVVRDDNGTQGNTADDFNATYVSGDTDLDGRLDVTETWTYTASRIASAGQYKNFGTVTGNPVTETGVDIPFLPDQTDTDVDHHFGSLPDIDIEKTTDGSPNGNSTDSDYDNEDAANGSGVPLLTPGTTVTWTYKVWNKGNVPFNQSEVVVTDDNGTPGNAADDLSSAGMTPAIVRIFVHPDIVGNGDNILEPGEVWVYQATGTVQNLSTPAGPAITFNMSGSSALDGPDGNIRTFTAGGVSVNASGFSRDKSDGAWSTAWLGAYGGGLGVTDSSEGDGGSNMHTVDNVGRDNYVLFEFSENVIVDSAFLGYVVNDSDLSVWIGTIPNAFSSHQTLSDALLAGLGFTEVNLTDLTGARTADFNAGNFAGNVLVIAGWTGDETPEDRFKIEKLVVKKPTSGTYENKGTVTVPGDTDSDLSHYKNSTTPPAPGIDIEKTTKGSPNGNPVAPDYNNEDAANGAGVPILTPGTTVTWTYKVKNTGNVAFTEGQVLVTDDNGTPGNTSDDLSNADGEIVRDLAHPDNSHDGDNLLEPGETWVYKATGTVQDLTMPAGPAITFNMSGSTATSGGAGNVRTFTAGGVSVHASGFSRDKSTGAWSTAWLGAYGGGLGVTDGSEGTGADSTHTVDNVGRDNYVLFEFSENVVVDSAYLGYVVNDSDMTVWIGTLPNAFNSHVILSDAVLLSLGFTEVNLTTLTGPRGADFNADNLSGNVLVIAAYTDDASPEDRFKIEKLTVRKPEAGIYENRGKVTVPGASDSDLSHYRNPQAPPATAAIDIEKYVKQVTQSTGGEGLTPGYWKQSQHFSSWVGYTRYQSYNEVFGVNDPGCPTLLSALGRGGGGYKALGRHAVAALLNASNPNIDYAYTKAQVIAMVQGAYATGNFEAVKNLLAKENEKGADLSSSSSTGSTPGYGDAADSAPGPTFAVGSTIMFTFVVTNTGSVELSPVVVIDDNATPGNTADDFSPTPVMSGGFNIGDDDDDGKLDPGESWLYTATRVVTAGQFTNIAKVTGTPVGGGANVTDSDPANWNAPLPSGSVSGYKFNDRNADGEWDKNGIDDCLGNSDDEVTLANWKVFADYDADGELDADEPYAVTNSSGYYKINGVKPGTWQINEVMQSGWIRTTDDWIVTVASGESKSNINFGNFCGNLVMSGDTATVGFWKGVNGQKLIKSLNQGGTYGTNVYVLGNWLATNFPRMYGNLAGKSNAQIATHFYNLACDSTKALDAQVMATVLAVYVTDSDWAGGTYAKTYGFNVTTTGVKNDYYNIGLNGAAFGVDNDAVLTVWDILQRTNARATNNVLWSGYSSTIKNMAKVVYTGINTAGGIT